VQPVKADQCISDVFRASESVDERAAALQHFEPPGDVEAGSVQVDQPVHCCSSPVG